MFYFFFFNDTATTEIYTLSLHDALPISPRPAPGGDPHPRRDAAHRGAYGGRGLEASLRGHRDRPRRPDGDDGGRQARSEEHTSELQSRQYLVCRLLLEKKKKLMTSHCSI